MRSFLLLNVLVLCAFALPVVNLDSDAQRILKAFQSQSIIPDVLSLASLSPPELLKVTYSGKIVNLGTQLYPEDTYSQPKVSWNADPNALYTLAKVDPDAPSRANPLYREYRHWLVVNIKGSDLTTGDVVTDYTPSTPPPTTSFHRYTLLVYKQSSALDLNNLGVTSDPTNFDIEKFAYQQGLGRPAAGNFFLCEDEIQ